MHHFRQRVGYAARADIMYRQYRIGVSQRTAPVDHLLRAALHFGITALHRIKIEVFLIGAGVHARRRTATETDQHAGAAQLNQQRARAGFFFERMTRRDIAHAARDHDRLVIAAHFTRDVLFIRTEIARQIRPSEFVVERGPANWAFKHDLQG